MFITDILRRLILFIRLIFSSIKKLNILCVYHAECPDGSTASWLFSRYHHLIYPNANVSFIGCKAGEATFNNIIKLNNKYYDINNKYYDINNKYYDINNKYYDIIFFLDVCPSDSYTMTSLYKFTKKIYVIDHHQTSKDFLTKYWYLIIFKILSITLLVGMIIKYVMEIGNDYLFLIVGVFFLCFYCFQNIPYQMINVNLCGAELTYMFLFNKNTLYSSPWFIKHIADQDLSRWLYPKSKHILLAIGQMFKFPQNINIQNQWKEFDRLSLLSEKEIDKLINTGNQLLIEQEKVVNKYIDQMHIMCYKNKLAYRVAIVFCEELDLISSIGDKILTNYGYIDFVVFPRNGTDEYWEYSLRSRKEGNIKRLKVNLLPIAKELDSFHNGGEYASGMKILKSYSLDGISPMFF